MSEMFTIMFGGYRSSEQIAAMRRCHCPFAVVCMPWALIGPHEKQALRNHSQTLKRLNERGGLSASEAVAVMEDRPWRAMTDADANLRLAALIHAHYEHSQGDGYGREPEHGGGR